MHQPMATRQRAVAITPATLRHPPALTPRKDISQNENASATNLFQDSNDVQGTFVVEAATLSSRLTEIPLHTPTPQEPPTLQLPHCENAIPIAQDQGVVDPPTQPQEAYENPRKRTMEEMNSTDGEVHEHVSSSKNDSAEESPKKQRC